MANDSTSPKSRNRKIIRQSNGLSAAHLRIVLSLEELRWGEGGGKRGRKCERREEYLCFSPPTHTHTHTHTLNSAFLCFNWLFALLSKYHAPVNDGRSVALVDTGESKHAAVMPRQSGHAHKLLCVPHANGLVLRAREQEAVARSQSKDAVCLR